MNAETPIIKQIAAGMTLPHDEPRCGHGFHKLHEGARVAVCIRRAYGTDRWSIVDVYCPEHAPDGAPETPHGTSALVHAKLGALVDTGRQTRGVALLAVEVADVTRNESRGLPDV